MLRISCYDKEDGKAPEILIEREDLDETGPK
jgi:hypothetical protein